MEALTGQPPTSLRLPLFLTPDLDFHRVVVQLGPFRGLCLCLPLLRSRRSLWLRSGPRLRLRLLLRLLLLLSRSLLPLHHDHQPTGLLLSLPPLSLCHYFDLIVVHRHGDHPPDLPDRRPRFLRKGAPVLFFLAASAGGPGLFDVAVAVPLLALDAWWVVQGDRLPTPDGGRLVFRVRVRVSLDRLEVAWGPRRHNNLDHPLRFRMFHHAVLGRMLGRARTRSGRGPSHGNWRTRWERIGDDRINERREGRCTDFGSGARPRLRGWGRWGGLDRGRKG